MVKEIEVQNRDGRLYTTKSYIQFNKKYSHIIIDDGCYQIVNGNRISSYIFKEAFYILQQLPSPTDMLDETKRKSFYLRYALDQA